MQIQGKKIILRTVLSPDADLLYKWENEKSNWEVSGTKRPFTKKEIDDYIAGQKDIYLDKQLRLMITISPFAHGKEVEVGCIDLFEFDSQKAGIGILIDTKHRKQGYASEALSLLIDYCFNTLNLHTLFCNISEDNKASIQLFQKQQFTVKEKVKSIFLLERVNK